MFTCCVFSFFCILDSLCWHLCIWISRLLFQVCFGREQTELFNSQLSLGFWMCLLVTYLGRWGLLSLLGQGHCPSSEVVEQGVGGGGCCHCWLQTVGQDCWFGSLLKWGYRMGSAVARALWSGLLRQPGLGTTLSRRQGYDLVSLLWWDSRTGPGPA